MLDRTPTFTIHLSVTSKKLHYNRASLDPVLRRVWLSNGRGDGKKRRAYKLDTLTKSSQRRLGKVLSLDHWHKEISLEDDLSVFLTFWTIVEAVNEQ